MTFGIVHRKSVEQGREQRCANRERESAAASDEGCSEPGHDATWRSSQHHVKSLGKRHACDRMVEHSVDRDRSFAAARRALKYVATTHSGGVTTFNAGGKCFVVGGLFVLTAGHADVLTSLLPPIVHVRSESERAELRWALGRMRQELEGEQHGSLLVAQQLAYMI